MESKPGDAVKIARYLEYYAHQAVRSGIVFVANLIAYDLGSLVLLGYQTEASCRRELFQVFMHFDQDHELKGYPGVVKAHLKLLLHVVYLGDEAEANELRGALAMVKQSDLRRAFEEISEVDEPYYWEITDRRHHVDYVEVFLRPTFARLRRELLGGEGSPVEPTAQEGK